MPYMKIVDVVIMLATLATLLVAALIAKKRGMRKGVPHHYFIFDLPLLTIAAGLAAAFLVTQFTPFRYRVLLNMVYIPAAVTAAAFLYALLIQGIEKTMAKDGGAAAYPLTARFFNASRCFAISWVIISLFFLVT